MEWPEPWSRLAACGWTTARLATLDDLPKRGLRELLEKAFGREATAEELEEIFRREMVAEVVDLEAPPSRKGKAPLARWPCRLSRLVGRAGDNMDLRDRAERSERTRWTVMLKRIIVESELPAAEGWNADPDGTAWHRIGKGRRSTTLRKHVKTWRHVATWLYSTFNVPWPRTIGQFIEYVMHRVAEPCGKSIPTSLMKTLMFIEVAGEVPEKAVQIPVEIIMAMERYVMTEGVPRYPRAYAWFRLVKLWGALRFSDTQGMPFGKLEMSGRGLRGVLERTKTTGAGKKVEIQHVFISVEAWLEEPRWLGVGYQLWKTMSEEAGLFNRDFLLALPNCEGTGIIGAMGKYYHASQMSQALLGELVMSWAASLGVDDYVAKQLGRWQPSTDQVHQGQRREGEKLAMQEMDANDVEDQKLRLTSFQGGIFASILGKDSWRASEKDPLEIVEVEDGDEASKNEETASEPDRTPEGYKS
ncbi:unnamed protein product, partial [Effrenium voratum]